MTPEIGQDGPSGDRCLRCGSELGLDVHDIAGCDRARVAAGLAPAPWWATCLRCGRLLHDVNRGRRALHRQSDCEARMRRLEHGLGDGANRDHSDPMSAGF